MLYILLIIIAIGVLLASEAGKSFLGLIIKLAIIGGLLYLGFWVFIFVIAFFNSDTGKSFASGAFQIIGGIFLLMALYYGGNHLIKITRDKDKRVKVWRKIKESYVKNKTGYIIWGIILGIIIWAVALPYFY